MGGFAPGREEDLSLYLFLWPLFPMFDERRPMMEQTKPTSSNEYGTDEIRQIQIMMTLFSCLRPDSKLREILAHALALPHEPWLDRISPASDPDFTYLKGWLENLWLQEGLNPDEQKLVDWQRSKENIDAVVQELKAIEQKIGLRFGILTF